MADSITKSIFEGRVRVRVCGILQEENAILMLKHKGIGPNGHLWSPPGGGIEFGENAEDALKKEFLEETGLTISVGQFLFVNEYQDDRHHAIELFFEVTRLAGEIQLGADPELPKNKQILEELRWLSFDEIKNMDSGFLHNAFGLTQEPNQITELRGFFKFANISIK
ncbi:NUDIX hydrolase [Marinoscillum sp. 108]|uniref:NUDIX domain-containing protein n=1 Tax=Marinoscillum sp. 108 TaxID=2653151 RepID=UPI0012F0506E|nr:NUDIX hydrolase [Marinoscillum sp. 108]VXD13020.1 ADP-ribose pyrophosphatase YjhB (NUDIX family) [Marinoscillum sp. 108]